MALNLIGKNNPIRARIFNHANTGPRRIGLFFLASGILLLVWGFALGLDDGWQPYDLGALFGIFMLLGTILMPVGAFLYSGIAEYLWSLIKTNKNDLPPSGE